MPFTPRDPYPDVGRTTTTLPGFRARKLGHVNVLTGQLEAMRDFYRDALGMSITDYLGVEGVWLHINADHHVMALVGKTPAHFHHFALDLVDWGNLRVAFDHLGQHGRWLGWGPVRHALGQNLCGYVRIPEEHCFVELYCDMEVLDLPHTRARMARRSRAARTSGASCRRARTSASTRRPSSPSATSSRRSARRCRPPERARVRGRRTRMTATTAPSAIRMETG